MIDFIERLRESIHTDLPVDAADLKLQAAMKPGRGHWLTAGPCEVAAGVYGLRLGMVNVYFVIVGRGFVLVDAGIPGMSQAIIDGAARLFGVGAKPKAIVLTHAHFDHVGSLPALVNAWPGVPVYAHRLELPFITGKSKYAPVDPWVGGAVALSSALYPRGPFRLSRPVEELPEDSTLPQMDDWRWIATPGHSPGHVSLFRASDRTLLAGDAFVTTRQESMLAVATQRQAVFGPPRYLTHDWQQAATSLRRLVGLNIEVAATGHGVPMSGPRLRAQLNDLSLHFEKTGIPRGGRYAATPANYNEAGLSSAPPAPRPPLRYIAGAGIVGFLCAAAIVMRTKRDAVAIVKRNRLRLAAQTLQTARVVAGPTTSTPAADANSSADCARSST